jgi:hypothetical protein
MTVPDIWTFLTSIYYSIVLFLGKRILISFSFFLNFSISPSPKLRFSHLYLFLLSSQVLQPVGKPASKQRFTQCVKTWRSLGWCIPNLAFSGSTTLKATVQQNVILTKRAGEEPLEPVEIICGFFSLWRNIPSFLSGLL